MMTYDDIERSPKVKSVLFIGGGIAVVKLNDGFTNEGSTEITAPFIRMAVDFVEGAAAAC